MNKSSDQKFSVKVNIADKVYPLKLTSSEEEVVRKAAEMINEKIVDYKSQYQLDEKADLLSICLLEFVSELVVLRSKSKKTDIQIQKKVNAIFNVLEEV